jgi:hypothetical protein
VWANEADLEAESLSKARERLDGGVGLAGLQADDLTRREPKCLGEAGLVMPVAARIWRMASA